VSLFTSALGSRSKSGWISRGLLMCLRLTAPRSSIQPSSVGAHRPDSATEFHLCPCQKYLLVAARHSVLAEAVHLSPTCRASPPTDNYASRSSARCRHYFSEVSCGWVRSRQRPPLSGVHPSLVKAGISQDGGRPLASWYTNRPSLVIAYHLEQAASSSTGYRDSRNVCLNAEKV
jgi:hypothetical protein